MRAAEYVVVLDPWKTKLVQVSRQGRWWLVVVEEWFGDVPITTWRYSGLTSSEAQDVVDAELIPG
jgi:hypothetical protein